MAHQLADGERRSQKETAARAGTRSGGRETGSSDRAYPSRGFSLAQFTFSKLQEIAVNHLLPQVAAARDRDRIARARLKAGEYYFPSKDELLEARAWKRGARS